MISGNLLIYKQLLKYVQFSSINVDTTQSDSVMSTL